jgi:hypothetical protein
LTQVNNWTVEIVNDRLFVVLLTSCQTQIVEKIIVKIAAVVAGLFQSQKPVLSTNAFEEQLMSARKINYSTLTKRMEKNQLTNNLAEVYLAPYF